MDMSTEDDEDEIESAEEEKEEEKESVEAESEVIDETIILADYMRRFETRRMQELAAKKEKAEEKKKQLRYLIGVEEKRKRDVSVETIITPEDELTVSDRVSTESLVHPCLREIDISESQLKILNPYTVYRVPDDPGLSPAFWLLRERPPIYGTDGVQKFYDMVKRAGIRSIASLKDLLITDQIDLRYYGLESQVMRAICEALMDNTYVRKVDLKDNKLSADACKHLNNLLLRNSMIINLSLSGCQIGASGAEKLYNAISTNATLKTLDLSNCNIGNEGFEYIASALSNNQGLESIDLSNNNLDESCAENLRNLLSYNETLTHLNLFWNSLYSAKTWKTLIKGFEKNETLRSLNLSWNGLGVECLPYLSQLLSRSRSIDKLDLSCNRFTEKDAIRIAKALSTNNTLQELYLGNNPVKAEGALALVHAITPHVSPDNVLHLLDLENVWANKDILHELEAIKMLKPEVKVKLRGILSNYQLVGPDIKKILLKRANYEAMAPKIKRRKRNFGHFVMSLSDKMISQEKFMALIKKFKLKLSKSLINEIMLAFEGPRGTVDQGQLKSFYVKEFSEATVN
ncbi:leucine-rich repeat-containing protein 74A-like isoform X2 [Linepithema humile]